MLILSLIMMTVMVRSVTKENAALTFLTLHKTYYAITKIPFLLFFFAALFAVHERFIRLQMFLTFGTSILYV